MENSSDMILFRQLQRSMRFTRQPLQFISGANQLKKQVLLDPPSVPFLMLMPWKAYIFTDISHGNQYTLSIVSCFYQWGQKYSKSK